MNKTYIPGSAMAIFAHPDDIEFSCAGTAARWAAAGCRMAYVIITDGDVGIADPGISKTEAAQIRRREAQQAAEIAGVAEVVFLGEPDGMLEATLELRRKLVREIRRFKPEVVITGDPSVILTDEDYINHPDHRAAATAALDAVFPAAGQPNLFEEIEQQEGITAFKPRKVFVGVWDKADTFVSIDETIETKVKALQAHKSQMNSWDPAEMIKNWAAETAKGKEMQYAEAYRVYTLVSDEDWEICQGDPIKLAQHQKNQAK